MATRATAAFSFGLISDVQYADVADALDKNGKMMRHYRGALDVLIRAVEHFNCFSSPPLSFVAQLGDIIDGKNAQANTSEAALNIVLNVIGQSRVPFVNLIGNHEIYNFDRDTLAKRLGTRPAGRPVEFYATAPVAGWRVFVLDAFQEAVVGWPPTEPRRQKAVEFLRAKRTECGRPDDADPSDWFAGLTGEDRRFCPYNGAFGARQLEWLRGQLRGAAEAGDRVIIMSHVVLHPKACGGTTMAWDYEEALAAIAEHPGTVGIVLCGHEHKGGFHSDPATGTHHLTVASPLNEGADGSAFGVAVAYSDRLELHAPRLASVLRAEDLEAARALDGGSGTENVLTLPLRPM